MTKILIAEYDDELRVCIKDFFEATKDFQIFTARTVPEAIRILEVEKTDWMFLAIEFAFARPTGLDLLPFFQIISPKTKIVTMTTDHSHATAKRALELGAIDCIVKPSISEPLRNLLVRMREERV